MKLSIAFALLCAKASYASWDLSNLPKNDRVLETDVPCIHSASKIKIQSTTGEPLSFREVRVYSSDVNVAISKTATQSSDLDDSSGASKAVDGMWRTKATTGNDEGCSTWWEVNLEQSTPINKVQIVNPDKSCKLSHATISLLDADGETVSAKIVGDTCDKGWVGRKFEYECPITESPTKNPTAAPVLSPTASPTKNPTTAPVVFPTISPTKNPTAAPVVSPTSSPTKSPTWLGPVSTDPLVFDPNYDCMMGGLGCYELKMGLCRDSNSQRYDFISSDLYGNGPTTDAECKDACPVTDGFRGFQASDDEVFSCTCFYENGTVPAPTEALPESYEANSGTGPMHGTIGFPEINCYKWHPPMSGNA
eukprot:scaffold8717_cov59-Cyclotella_meneghiniana.AAC.4